MEATRKFVTQLIFATIEAGDFKFSTQLWFGE